MKIIFKKISETKKDLVDKLLLDFAYYAKATIQR